MPLCAAGRGAPCAATRADPSRARWVLGHEGGTRSSASRSSSSSSSSSGGVSENVSCTPRRWARILMLVTFLRRCRHATLCVRSSTDTRVAHATSAAYDRTSPNHSSATLASVRTACADTSGRHQTHSAIYSTSEEHLLSRRLHLRKRLAQLAPKLVDNSRR